MHDARCFQKLAATYPESDPQHVKFVQKATAYTARGKEDYQGARPYKDGLRKQLIFMSTGTLVLDCKVRLVPVCSLSLDLTTFLFSYLDDSLFAAAIIGQCFVPTQQGTNLLPMAHPTQQFKNQLSDRRHQSEK